MAKLSTIRLKKTELPVDKYTAADNAITQMVEFQSRLKKLFEKLHSNTEGQSLSSMSAMQKDVFFNKMVANMQTVSMRLHEKSRQFLGKRLADTGSANAPWVWKVLPETGNPKPNWDQKSPTPEFVYQNDAWLEARLDFEERLQRPVGASSAQEDVLIANVMNNHRKYQALRRYVRRLDWACIANGIPVRVGVAIRTPYEGAFIRLGVAVQVRFEATYLQGKKYTPNSMLGYKAYNMLPATFDLAGAREAFEDKGDVTLSSRKFAITQLILPLSNSGTVTPTTEWLEALASGKRGTNEQICQGVAPLPPHSEIVTLVPFFEHIDEMKRVIKTLMRIAKPYDRISFLPITG